MAKPKILKEIEEVILSRSPARVEKVFGDWGTIYAGLSALPEEARTSWFKWDHYSSDAAFAQALPTAGAVVTFNGKSFDMPMIRERSIIHRVEQPPPGRVVGLQNGVAVSRGAHGFALRACH